MSRRDASAFFKVLAEQTETGMTPEEVATAFAHSVDRQSPARGVALKPALKHVPDRRGPRPFSPAVRAMLDERRAQQSARETKCDAT